MRRPVRAIVFLPVLVLVLVLPTRLYAQENGVTHPLTFAELTYGDAIQGIVADGSRRLLVRRIDVLHDLTHNEQRNTEIVARAAIV